MKMSKPNDILSQWATGHPRRLSVRLLNGEDRLHPKPPNQNPKPIISFTHHVKPRLMVVALDLLDFLLRARVLKLYRHALRTARRAPDPSRSELQQIMRQEMENNRNCRDKQRIRFLISEALERLKRLDEMLDMQGH